MKRAATITLISTIAIFATLIAYRNLSPSNEAWAASTELKKENYYGFGYKSYPDEYTDTTKHFRTIVASPKSYLVFRELYDDGGYVAKAYAIAGLHQTLIGRFDSRIAGFREMDCSIPVIFHNPLSPEQVLAELSSEHFQNNIQRPKR